MIATKKKFYSADDAGYTGGKEEGIKSLLDISCKERDFIPFYITFGFSQKRGAFTFVKTPQFLCYFCWLKFTVL